MEEKEKLWSELEEVVKSFPREETQVIGAEFSGQVGEEDTGDEEVMDRNLEGQMVVDSAERMEMTVMKT